MSGPRVAALCILREADAIVQDEVSGTGALVGRMRREMNVAVFEVRDHRALNQERQEADAMILVDAIRTCMGSGALRSARPTPRSASTWCSPSSRRSSGCATATSA